MNRLCAFPRIRLQIPGKDWRLFPGLAALCPGLFSFPRLRNSEQNEIRHPIQWSATTEYDVVRSGNYVRRDNSNIHAEGATGCLLKHNFRVAGQPAMIKYLARSFEVSRSDSVGRHWRIK
jgi:hypothetical protein